MTSTQSILLEEVPDCYLCHLPGSLLYQDLQDRLFGAPGSWSLSRCDQCGLVWLNPRPVPADIHKVYATYYTHQPSVAPAAIGAGREKLKRAVLGHVSGLDSLIDGWVWGKLGSILSKIPTLRNAARVASMCMTKVSGGRLLDVGCGGGQFLALMRDAGWGVEGVDIDPAAAAQAMRQYGIRVHVGTLHQLDSPAESFDAITLHHVIEHVFDPVEYLVKCRELLKPGGRLVMVTPNVESRGHRDFRECWRALEPPRHLMLFSLRTLRTCAEKSGLRVQELWSSARGARRLWAMSHMIRKNGKFSDSDINRGLLLRGLAYQIRDELALRKEPGEGEELILVATK